MDVGILLGYISNYAFSKMSLQMGWRIMLGVGAIPSLVLTMPESPRWLVMRGRLGDATKLLEKTSNSKEEAWLRLADIKRAAGIFESNTEDIVQVPQHAGGESVWKQLFLSPTPAVLHMVIAALGIHFFQQASGIDLVVLYSHSIFEMAGIRGDANQHLAIIAIGFVKTVFNLVGTLMSDRVGRRPLLLTSIGGMALSLITLAINLSIIHRSKTKLTWAIALCITMVFCYVATFSIGAGTITRVYSSEIFPLRLRAQYSYKCCVE